MTNFPNLLPLYLAARRIGVKPNSLRAAAEAGELPYVRVGDDLLFDVDRIEQLLAVRARHDKATKKTQP